MIITTEDGRKYKIYLRKGLPYKTSNQLYKALENASHMYNQAFQNDFTQMPILDKLSYLGWISKKERI